MPFKAMLVGTLALALPLGIWATVHPGTAPDIEVSPTHNLGTVQKGKKVTADLPVRNTGSAPLIVAGIVTSCGCTTATLSTLMIPPGEQATLHIEYDSTAHESDRGKLERSIFISSNDPDEADLQIQLSVWVQPELSDRRK